MNDGGIERGVSEKAKERKENRWDLRERRREAGKNKYIESDKWRERGIDKGEMEREYICFG